jgi:hypothetical protein
MKAPRPSTHPYPNDRINSASSTEATIKMLPFTAQAQGIRAGAFRFMRLLKYRANLILGACSAADWMTAFRRGLSTNPAVGGYPLLM